ARSVRRLALKGSREKHGPQTLDVVPRNVDLSMPGQIGAQRRGALSTILGSVSEAVVIVAASGQPLFANEAFRRLPVDVSGALVALNIDGSPVAREAM